MADLEARYKPDDSRGWTRALPVTPVKVGRVQPNSDWDTPWDALISRVHATLEWRNGELRVRRWMDPPTTNAIYFDGRPTDEFTVRAGDCFQIGETVFTLRDTETASDVTSAFVDEPPSLIEHTCSAQELRSVPFLGADQRIEALASLPEIIRFSPADDQVEQKVVDVLLRGIPDADYAALIELPEVGDADSLPVPIVRRMAERGPTQGEVRPSRSLVHKAVRRVRQSVLHVWSTDPQDNDATFSPGAEWALCTPLPDDPTPGWGLYVTGRLRRNIKSPDNVAHDVQFKSDLRFAELTGDIFGALRQVRDLQQRLSLFSTFLSRPVLAALLSARQNLEDVLKARETEVTVLFCDLRGSCMIAEQGSADLQCLWNNVCEALSIMTHYIIDQDGVIGDFQGDAAMGFWGWPFSYPDQIERAAKAALNIQKRFHLVSQRRDSPLYGFACGIGLAHGTAMAGRLGTLDQFKVGVFGPVVNLASRLEGMTKHFRVPILVNEAILNSVKGVKNNNWGRARRAAKVQPKGMIQPVLVGELLPPLTEPGALLEPKRLNYESAVDAFLDGRWPDAQNLLRFLPGDGPAEVLKRFIDANPKGPPPNWSGVIPLESK